MSNQPRNDSGQFTSSKDTGGRIGVIAVIVLGILAIALFTPLSPLNATILTGIVSGSILGGAGFDAFLQFGDFFGFFAAVPATPADLGAIVGDLLVEVGASPAGAVAGAILATIAALRYRG